MTDWTLERHPRFPGVEGPVLVVVMDGVGCGLQDESDAVWLARTPNLDFLAANVPSTRLKAHGIAVGMPSDDDMGNSEVGHNALGAGRVFSQGAQRVRDALASRELFGSEWQRLVDTVRRSGEPMHFLGLLSDGNVHSHIEHLFAMLRRCHAEGIPRVRVHILLDGRDVEQTSALRYVEALEHVLRELRSSDRDYRIASGGGRMTTTMDRYNADWSMVERGWRAHVLGQARAFSSAREAIETFRDEDPGIIDQFLPAFVIAKDGEPVGPIREGAAVVMFNFRGDRAIEISRAFEEEDFSEFDRGPRLDVAYAGMMQYDGDLLVPKHYLVEPPAIDRTLGEYMVHNSLRLFACSETQKYGHVTYFWNGNRGGMIDESCEVYVEVPSDRVPFEERPWMQCAQITDRTIAELSSGRFRHGRINFANGDMVGHTGNREAAILAVESTDLCIGRLMRAAKQWNGALVVTADHGNADEMFMHDKKGAIVCDPTGHPAPKTSHTLNPVPFHVYAPGVQGELAICASVPNPGLANVAATVLHLLGYQRPDEYEPSLLV